MNDKNHGKKLNDLFFLKSLFYEIARNFILTEEISLRINSFKIIFLNINHIIFLLTKDIRFLNQMNWNIFEKYKKLILGFIPIYRKDFISKKNYFISLEDVQKHYYHPDFFNLNKANYLYNDYFNKLIEGIKFQYGEDYFITNMILNYNEKTDILNILLNQNIINHIQDEIEDLNAKIKNLIKKSFNIEFDITLLDFDYEQKNNFLLSNLRNYTIIDFNYDYSDIVKKLNHRPIMENDFISILEENNVSVSKGTLNQYIQHLRYKREKDYPKLLIPDEYINYADLIEKSEIIDGIHFYSNSIKNDYYDFTIENLINKNVLFKINNMTFIGQQKFKEANIQQHDFETLYNRIDKLIQEDGFTSHKIITESIKNPILEIYGSKVFIYSILNIENKYTKLSFTNGYLFTFKNSSNSKKTLITNFFNSVSSYDLYDIIYEINEKFGVIWKDSDLLKDIKGTGLYFSKETEKLYKNKETFFKEIELYGKSEY
jgi:acyl carrier protein